MRFCELKDVLEGVCPGSVFYGEAAGHKPPYIVCREKTETEFFGACTVVELIFYTGSDSDALFYELKEALTKNGLIFSFSSSLDKDTAIFAWKADVYLPNAEIELVAVEYAANGFGCYMPVSFKSKSVPCVVVDEKYEGGGKYGQPVRPLLTVRVQELLYNGEKRAEINGRAFTLASARNSLNGSIRQADVGYLELTFREA